MKIGVPKEIKASENRVALTPSGVEILKSHGHSVYVETNAGLGSGFKNEDYTVAGAQILPNAKDVFDGADMIMKVKEPIPVEYPLIRKGQLLFTYFHFAAARELTDAILKSRAIAVQDIAHQLYVDPERRREYARLLEEQGFVI